MIHNSQSIKPKALKKCCVQSRSNIIFLVPFLWDAIFCQVASLRWQGSACRIKRAFVMSRHVLGLSADATKGPPTPSGTITRPLNILDCFFSQTHVWSYSGNICDLRWFSKSKVEWIFLTKPLKINIQSFKSLLISKTYLYIIIFPKLIANESVVDYLGQSKQRKEKEEKI